MHPDLEKAIRIVLLIAHRKSLEPTLVGGLASELAARTLDPPPTVRGTNDADFAIRMRSWDDFATFKEAMVAEGFSQDSRIEHRFTLGEAIVDLLPYGSEIAQGEEIRWPVADQVMVITGFEEACAAGVETDLGSELTVRRVSIPGLVLLKIISFLDRRQAGHPKHKSDAEDLHFWMNNFATGADEGRRYELVDHGIEDVEYTEAGTATLGMDVASLASEAADRRIRDFLPQCDDEFSAFIGCLISPGADEDRSNRVRLTRAFRIGYQTGRAERS